MTDAEFDIAWESIFNQMEESIASSFNLSKDEVIDILDSNDVYNAFYKSFSEFISFD